MSHPRQSRSLKDPPATEAPPVGPPRLGRKQILVIGLLLLIGIVNYLDRSTLSIANSSISGELDLSATQIGLLLSVFSWSYAFAQLPVGPLLDRFGARTTLGIGLLLWSIAQGAAGLIQNFGQFLIARIALGLGEGPMFPANAKVVGETFSKEHRGRPIGVTNSASTIGPALAPPILTWLLLSFGWRTMFIVMGAAGVVLALAWLALYRNPERVAEVDRAVDARHGITGDDAADAEGGAKAKNAGARPSWSFKEWLFLLRFRTTWSMIGGWVGVIYSVYLYLTWLPAYLEKDRGFSLADLGWALVLPYVAGTIGQLFSGVFGDWMVAHTRNITRARKWPVVLGLAVGGAFSVPAALVASPWPPSRSSASPSSSSTWPPRAAGRWPPPSPTNAPPARWAASRTSAATSVAPSPR